MDKYIEQKVIDFLKTQEKYLRRNDLNAVYNNLPKRTATHLTEFLLSKGIDPLLYLKEVIPNRYAFELKNCYQTLNIPDGIYFIEKYAFACTDVEKLHIPKSVTFIEDYAFIGCNSLKEIYIDGCPEFEDIYTFDGATVKDRTVVLNCSKEQFMRTNMATEYVADYFDVDKENIKFLQ